MWIVNVLLISKGNPGILNMSETSGELPKKFIKPRLTDVIRAPGHFSPKQYGFKTGRFIIDTTEEVGLTEEYGRHCWEAVLFVTLE